MHIHNPARQPTKSGDASAERISPALPQWLIVVLVTLAMAALWTVARHLGGGDLDQEHYLAMARGQQEMKPFALRFLAPAVVRVFTQITGQSIEQGFLFLGVLSGWMLLYGVLSLVLRRRHGLWFALVITVIPFWPRILIDYRLADLPHAALCIVYLLLLRRRAWAWASVTLAVMFLARESTLLIALIAVPVLWRLAGRRVGLLHLAATGLGMAGSKFFTRHALPNHQNMNDTLYLLGKIPWNLSRNVFGVTLWSNTMPLLDPIRTWNVPRWIHAGDLHQVGYSHYNWWYQTVTLSALFSSFGIGFCIVLCLWWRLPLRALLPRDKPYLCIAALYGAAAYLLAPMLGASETRLFDYGWPLFLVYLPAVILTVWRSAPSWTIYALLALNLLDAWGDMAGRIFHMPFPYNLLIYPLCNLAAAWLLLNQMPRTTGAMAFDGSRTD